MKMNLKRFIPRLLPTIWFIIITRQCLLKIDDAEDAAKGFGKYGFLPKITAVRGNGVYACGESEKAAQTAAELFCDTVKIAVYAESFGGGVFMPDWLIDFIANWEVESYVRV